MADALADVRPDIANVLYIKLERLMAKSAPRVSRVKIGTRLLYSMANCAAREAELVFPEAADAHRGYVSILTPVGAALLDMSTGETASYTGNDGHKRTLTVIDILE